MACNFCECVYKPVVVSLPFYYFTYFMMDSLHVPIFEEIVNKFISEWKSQAVILLTQSEPETATTQWNFNTPREIYNVLAQHEYKVEEIQSHAVFKIDEKNILNQLSSEYKQLPEWQWMYQVLSNYRSTSSFGDILVKLGQLYQTADDVSKAEHWFWQANQWYEWTFCYVAFFNLGHLEALKELKKIYIQTNNFNQLAYLLFVVFPKEYSLISYYREKASMIMFSYQECVEIFAKLGRWNDMDICVEMMLEHTRNKKDYSFFMYGNYMLNVFPFYHHNNRDENFIELLQTSLKKDYLEMMTMTSSSDNNIIAPGGPEPELRENGVPLIMCFKSPSSCWDFNHVRDDVRLHMLFTIIKDINPRFYGYLLAQFILFLSDTQRNDFTDYFFNKISQSQQKSYLIQIQDIFDTFFNLSDKNQLCSADNLEKYKISCLNLDIEIIRRLQ